jgi:hypothetical protein
MSAGYAERLIGRLHQAIDDAIAQRVSGSPNAGIFTTLAIGEGNGLDAEHCGYCSRLAPITCSRSRDWILG